MSKSDAIRSAATFDTSLNCSNPGGLINAPAILDNIQAQSGTPTIQQINSDVLLIDEFDAVKTLALVQSVTALVPKVFVQI